MKMENSVLKRAIHHVWIARSSLCPITSWALLQARFCPQLLLSASMVFVGQPCGLPSLALCIWFSSLNAFISSEFLHDFKTKVTLGPQPLYNNLLLTNRIWQKWWDVTSMIILSYLGWLEGEIFLWWLGEICSHVEKANVTRNHNPHPAKRLHHINTRKLLLLTTRMSLNVNSSPIWAFKRNLSPG
jgi:hypothetical protein